VKHKRISARGALDAAPPSEDVATAADEIVDVESKTLFIDPIPVRSMRAIDASRSISSLGPYEGAGVFPRKWESVYRRYAPGVENVDRF
jgi:hypothetical protein